MQLPSVSEFIDARCSQGGLDRSASLQSHWHGLLLKSGLGVGARKRLCTFLSGPGSTAIRTQLAALFVEVLGEPMADARALAAQWVYYRALTRGAWLLAGQHPARVLDEEALGAYLAGSNGVVLASIHMGDYLQGLAALAGCLQGRKLLILRRLEASRREEVAFSRFSRAGIDFEVLRHDRRAAFTAVRALRGGGVLVALYDLPRRWGRTAPVKLFGREAAIVCGPVQLARAAGADIVPIVTSLDECGLHEIEAGAVLRTDGAFTAAGVLQHLAGFAEARIRLHPAQWNHWTLFPELVQGEEADGG